MRAKTRLNCPCGAAIAGADEDDLVDKTQGHLAEAHPGMEYSRDEILFIAYWLDSESASIVTLTGIPDCIVADFDVYNKSIAAPVDGFQKHAAELRKLGPVVYSTAHGGPWLVTRYEEAHQVLRRIPVDGGLSARNPVLADIQVLT